MADKCPRCGSRPTQIRHGMEAEGPLMPFDLQLCANDPCGLPTKLWPYVAALKTEVGLQSMEAMRQADERNKLIMENVALKADKERLRKALTEIADTPVGWQTGQQVHRMITIAMDALAAIDAAREE